MKMEQKFMDKTINIIDPTSTEFNRGSFCYAPYLCYNGLKELDYDVHLYEVFRSEDLDHINLTAGLNVISLWSYPQIEVALLLAQFIPFETGKDNVYFVGYTPLIEEMGFRHVREVLGFDPLSDEVFLNLAMRTYPKYYGDFRRLLLSDCDMHIKDLEQGAKVYPLFTTYGCPHGCSFCPSAKNCGRQRTILSLTETFALLANCDSIGVRNIHFTDEDFFFDIDRAHKILKFIAKLGKFHLIALGAAQVVREYIEKYGTEVLESAGMEVIEIGFESAGADVMGAGKSMSDCEALAEMQKILPFKIFWLVQTFYMGENLHTLNETGRFMREYGLDMDEVVGRLRTNGTKGGLGQFFQVYHGTPIYKVASRDGLFITPRAVRLLPSYIPQSFLDAYVTEIRLDNFDSAIPWLELYNIDAEAWRPDEAALGIQIKDRILGASPYEQIKRAIALAILARMEVIS
jgi:hypothetical protein